jgi:hypothetical protein
VDRDLGVRSKEWVALLEREREKHREEVAKLLDRIQFPDVRQVQPVDSEPPEIPKDAAELAFVGLEVPTGYDVGGDE